jgi:hypothetical protein
MWFIKISVRMFIKDHGNKKAYYVCRVPSVIAKQDEAKCVQCTAYVARKLLAAYHTREMRRHFKKVISSGEKIREGHIQALYRELTDDNSAIPANLHVESDVGTTIEAGYDLKDTMSLVETNNNLRAGKYATFLQVAFDTLHGDNIDAASQRRHGTQLYMGEVLSIRGLRDRVIHKVMDAEVCTRDEVPAPSLEWLQLQFSASNPFHKVNSCMRLALKVKVTLQYRGIAHTNLDGHYASAQLRLLREWVIFIGLEDDTVFANLDNKTRIPVSHYNSPCVAVAHQK